MKKYIRSKRPRNDTSAHFVYIIFEKSTKSSERTPSEKFGIIHAQILAIAPPPPFRPKSCNRNPLREFKTIEYIVLGISNRQERGHVLPGRRGKLDRWVSAGETNHWNKMAFGVKCVIKLR